MLKYLMEIFNKIFPDQNSQHNLELYIASKNPTTTHEVEYWIAQYEKNRHNRQFGL